MRKLLIVLALFGHAAVAAEGDSGVAGTLELTNACRGAQKAGASCTIPYAQGLLHLLDQAGNTVASATADEQGSFHITAPAGRYRLHVVVEGAYPRCEDVSLQIKRKRISRLKLQCDSGMR